jgi:hypothetical protein
MFPHFLEMNMSDEERDVIALRERETSAKDGASGTGGGN